MQGIIYLRLDYPTADQVMWRTSDGNQSSGTLNAVSELINGQRVVVFVSSSEISLLETTLPTRKKERLMQAVPYAVEEHLAANVDTLHFALGQPSPATSDGNFNIPVAVVARSRMETWLARLNAAGINPHALIPDILTLPFTSGTWTLLREANVNLLRTGLSTGFAIELDWLTIAVAQASEPPSSITVINDNWTASFAQSLPKLPLEITERPCPPDGTLSLLIEGYHPSETINLLQGTYNRHEQVSRLWRPWRLSAAILAIVIILQFVGLIMEKHRLSSEEIALRTRMADIYQRAFPDARRIVNPKVQMEQRLNSLRSQPEGGGDSFLGLLARVAPLISSTAGLDLRALRYKDNNLELDFSLKNLQIVDQFKQKIIDKNLSAEIRAARVQGDKVDSNIIIKNQVPRG